MNFNNLCCVNDYEKLAVSKLSKNVADYYIGGGYSEFSLNLSKNAFKRLRIRPRMLRDVSQRNTKCNVLTHNLDMPIGVAPTAMQKMCHSDGECANVKAVGRLGSIMILSTLSTTSLEEVAKASPNTIKWFQLYIYKNRQVSEEIIRRAEIAGYKGLVLTVDAPIFASRYRDMRNNFQLPSHLTLGNFNDAKSNLNVSTNSGSALMEYVDQLFDDSINWDDIKWLKKITTLPIILKGILTREDAEIAADLGVSGIIVSNHGARQIDTCPAPIEALPEIVKAVGNTCEIYLDGGIRYGSDIFKALALGAKMVFVGRPVLWGLTCGGEEGVYNVLNILRRELIETLALAGCANIADIQKEMVVHESFYSKF